MPNLLAYSDGEHLETEDLSSQVLPRDPTNSIGREGLRGYHLAGNFSGAVGPKHRGSWCVGDAKPEDLRTSPNFG